MATFKIAIILSIESDAFKGALKTATNFAISTRDSEYNMHEEITAIDVHPEILGSHPDNNPKKTHNDIP